MFDCKILADNDSIQHPGHLRHVHGRLVFKLLKSRGGLVAMEKTNLDKAGLLYDALDATGFCNCAGGRDNRSLMNVPFTSRTLRSTRPSSRPPRSVA